MPEDKNTEIQNPGGGNEKLLSIVNETYIDKETGEPIASLISRDQHLIQGDYLTEDLKNSYPDVYENFEKASKLAVDYYTIRSEFNQKVNNNNDLYARLNNHSGKFNNQFEVDNFNSSVEIFNSNIEELQKEEDELKLLYQAYQNGMNTTFEINQKLLTEKKSLNQLDYILNFETFDLMTGSDYRSNASLGEFDFLTEGNNSKVASSVGYDTYINEYSTEDFLNAQSSSVANDFKNKVTPMYQSILTKGLDRLNENKKEEIDISNGDNMEILIRGLFQSTSKTTQEKIGIDIKAIQNEINNAESLSQKENIIYSHKEDFQKILSNLGPTELRRLFEITNNKFNNNSFYFESPEQEQDFVNKIPIEIKDIDQYQKFNYDITKQAVFQVASEYKNQLVELESNVIVGETKDLNYSDNFNLFIKNYMASNLYDKETGELRSLNDIMLKFQEDYKDDIDGAKSYLEDTFNPNKQIETGLGGIKTATPENLIAKDYLIGLEAIQNTKALSKNSPEIAKKIKKLQKQYEKTALPENVIYIENYDADGNLYYDVDVIQTDENNNPILDENGDEILMGAGAITNSKDVKRIKNALRSNNEIEQLIQDEIDIYIADKKFEDKELASKDFIKNSAIEIWAASEMYNNIAYESPGLGTIQGLKLSPWQKFTAFAEAAIKSTFNLNKDFFTTYGEELDERQWANVKNYDDNIQAVKDNDNDVLRRIEAYNNIKIGSEDPSENNIRKGIYEMYANLTTDIQKEKAKVKINTIYPSNLSIDNRLINDKSANVMNKFSRGAGTNMIESLVKNFSDIDLNKKETEKTKAVNKIIELATNSGDIVVIADKYDYTGTRKKDSKETEKNLKKLTDALANTNKKINLNYYSYAGNLKTNAYEFVVDGKKYTIYADKEEMNNNGELIEKYDSANSDYALLEATGGWNFSTLNNDVFKNNRITIDKNRNIIWEYTDDEGEKYNQPLDLKLNSERTIDEIEDMIKTIIIAETNP